MVVHDYEASLRAWLKGGLAKKGKSKGGLAAALGVEPSAVSRVLKGGRRLQANEIPKAAAYLGSAPPQAVAPRRGAGGPPEAVTRVRVVGDVAAGRWEEANPLAAFYEPDMPETDRYPPVPLVPDERYRGMPQSAVHVVGTSMDKVIPDGYFAIFVPYWEARSAITEGDLVVVQRRQGDLFEGTLKRLAKGKGGWELRPESNDPRFQAPVQIPDNTEKTDDVEVEIVGLVIWKGAPT